MSETYKSIAHLSIPAGVRDNTNPSGDFVPPPPYFVITMIPLRPSVFY